MNIRYIIGFIMLTLLLQSCHNTYDYQEVIKEELESGVSVNQILLDMHFGMNREDFFEYCWKLNKDQKAEQGSKNRTVKVRIDELDKEAYMLFYPTFENDKIVEMPILFGYEDWSPWNRESYASKLILKVKDLINDWYDIKLTLVKDSNEYPGYIHVQGNRKLTLIIQDDQYVKLLVTDLSKIDNPIQPLTFKRT